MRTTLMLISAYFLLSSHALTSAGKRLRSDEEHEVFQEIEALSDPLTNAENINFLCKSEINKLFSQIKDHYKNKGITITCPSIDDPQFFITNLNRELTYHKENINPKKYQQLLNPIVKETIREINQLLKIIQRINIFILRHKQSPIHRQSTQYTVR